MITPKVDPPINRHDPRLLITASNRFAGVRKDHETKAITDCFDWVSRIRMGPKSSRLYSTALH
jgi:hypothetical protein